MSDELNILPDEIGNNNFLPPNNSSAPSRIKTASICSLIYSLFHVNIGLIVRSLKLLFNAYFFIFS